MTDKEKSEKFDLIVSIITVILLGVTLVLRMAGFGK